MVSLLFFDLFVTTKHREGGFAFVRAIRENKNCQETQVHSALTDVERGFV